MIGDTYKDWSITSLRNLTRRAKDRCDELNELQRSGGPLYNSCTAAQMRNIAYENWAHLNKTLRHREKCQNQHYENT